MLNQFKIDFCILITILLFLTAEIGCSKGKKPTSTSNVPQSWYKLPEDHPQPSKPDHSETSETEKLSKLSRTVDTFFNANTQALEKSSRLMHSKVTPQDATPPPGMPKDWTPWHVAMFMTDLSVSASGLIGVLTEGGNATVRAYWRKQGPVREIPQVTAELPDSNSVPVITIDETTRPEELAHQMDPAIRAAVATGKIQDTLDLRTQLLAAAQDFQSVAALIPTTDPQLPWWVSRFRIDLAVDASGQVVPMGSLGGEVRFCIEWHRIKRKNLVTSQSQSLTERQATIQSSLSEFITATAHDLEHAFEGNHSLGFKPYMMRVGIGMTARGNIGLVRGGAGIVGQLFFSRNVKRPTVRPQSFDDEESSDHRMLIIERKPIMRHLLFARKNHIPVQINSLNEKSPLEEAVYQIDRKVFRKGLKKAAKISQFFAERAATTNQSSGWKVYELRTGFDLSISGMLDLVTLAGAVSAEIFSFNENF